MLWTIVFLFPLKMRKIHPLSIKSMTHHHYEAPPTLTALLLSPSEHMGGQTKHQFEPEYKPNVVVERFKNPNTLFSPTPFHHFRTRAWMTLRSSFWTLFLSLVVSQSRRRWCRRRSCTTWTRVRWRWSATSWTGSTRAWSWTCPSCSSTAWRWAPPTWASSSQVHTHTQESSCFLRSQSLVEDKRNLVFKLQF